MDLAELLAEIDRLKGEIDDLRPIDAVLEQKIMQKFRLDWNYHSNAIEGNSLTLGETRAFLLHGLTAKGKPFKDYLDIKGHNESIQYLEELVRKRPPMTEAMIRELHKILLVEPYEVKAKTPDGLPTSRIIQIGQYKTTPNHVETKTGEIFYFAEPAAVPAMMNELITWVRETEEARDVHPLIIAATLHYRFVRIHPFDDGNGRMARLLMNLVLMRAGYPPVVIRLEDKEGEYFPALTEADADGDLEPLTLFIGKELLRSEEMFLSGAKGEDIATNGDLEKKISLLQQRIDSLNQAKTQHADDYKAKKIKFANSQILPFVENISEIVLEISRVFESFEIYHDRYTEENKFESINELISFSSQPSNYFWTETTLNWRLRFALNQFSGGDLKSVISFDIDSHYNRLGIKIGTEISGTYRNIDMSRVGDFSGDFLIEEKLLVDTEIDLLKKLANIISKFEETFLLKLEEFITKNE